MDDTVTYITWPSKMKIGAKSKKDPHIRICGKPDNIKEARQRVMQSLDTKSNRVTIKMDVSHTEHSHVIGKGGNNIKRVMQETGCHIHFPDSNRNNVAEKSNQVSITGHPEGVENARTKIRSLLPVVLTFEIPNAGMPMPDPNSPMIQHVVQAYGISIQFKQRVKVYSTTCTIRGSSDNLEGVKTGVQTLMNHVAGAQLPVTTQIEIAPQHHAYMLSKTGMNINTIIQSTGARIIFPDPNALPKKSTVYVNGSIESVLLARHKLMCCLPILLMFDTKAESTNTRQDGVTIAHLMESLDIFINIKLKPKQPSKTVIIKSMEYNIYNMFEARAKLLGLDTPGIQRPNLSLSPQLTTSIPTKNGVSPVILLAQSHVPTPTVQTHVLSLTEPKSITQLPCAVLNAPGYVITHNVPSNPGTPRPLSALSVHTPSQSPYPGLAPTSSNVVPGLGSTPMTSQEMRARDQNSIQENARIDNFSNVSNSISPPSSIPLPNSTQVSHLGGIPPVYQRSPSHQQSSINMMTNGNNRSSLRVMQHSSNMNRNFQQYNVDRLLPDQSENQSTFSDDQDYDSKSMALLSSRTAVSQSGLDDKDNFENNHRFSKYDLKQTVPNHYVSNTSIPGDYHKNVHSLPSTYSQIKSRNADNIHDVNQRMISENMSHPFGSASHYPHDVSHKQDDQILHHIYTSDGNIGNTIQNISTNHSTSVSSILPGLGQSIYSPDSINGSRNSLGSDRNSPRSSLSDRLMDNPGQKLGYEHFEEHNMHRSPSPVTSSNPFQSPLNRNVNSPLNGRSHVQTHQGLPQIVLNHQSDNGQYDSGDSNQLRENDVPDIYNQPSSVDPPPGFESTVPTGQPAVQKTDYELLRRLAQKAIKKKPVVSQIRTPTDVWSGCGFSKSMPFQMKEDLKKVASRFRNNLPTTYENGDMSPDRNQPSPVNEEDEDTLDSQASTHLRVPMSQYNPKSGKSSNLNAWRRKNVMNMNLSLGGHVGLNFMGSMQRRQQNHSAFTPVHPNESLNRTSSSPKANPASDTLAPSRQMINSPFNKSGNERMLSGNERMLSYPHPENPVSYDSRMNMSSTPTIQDSLGLNVAAGNKNKVEADIADVLNRLDLSKYVPVFQQQEVDFQTFLTLTEPDLKELGISTFGPRKKILLAIKDLNKDRDVFSVAANNDSVVHENPSDQMLQLQRLQLQQHRDNPHPKRHLEVPQATIDRRPVFHEDGSHQNVGSDRVRHITSRNLWQNSRGGVSSSGRW